MAVTEDNISASVVNIAQAVFPFRSVGRDIPQNPFIDIANGDHVRRGAQGGFPDSRFYAFHTHGPEPKRSLGGRPSKRAERVISITKGEVPHSPVSQNEIARRTEEDGLSRG